MCGGMLFCHFFVPHYLPPPCLYFYLISQVLASSCCWVDHNLPPSKWKFIYESSSFPTFHLAALLSVIQLLCTLIISLVYTRVVSTLNGSNRAALRQIEYPQTENASRKNLRYFFSSSSCLFLSSASLLPPIRSLFRLEADRGQRGEVQYGFTTDYYTELFVNRRGSVFYVPPIRATINSLAYAGSDSAHLASAWFPGRACACKTDPS